ncbi:unnamed protein product [Trypanosoma congolense IL3000]|uniref:WGS project CAEQ00000000 data, annotated contig 2116 n=1 Tax=Trypanosoma congolense (strain IL3000) TaxID=1068625 RepID=F9WBK7_TRYCI|nr:unnamed protein product [Trypanosoma congolense IL3000]
MAASLFFTSSIPLTHKHTRARLNLPHTCSGRHTHFSRWELSVRNVAGLIGATRPPSYTLRCFYGRLTLVWWLVFDRAVTWIVIISRSFQHLSEHLQKKGKKCQTLGAHSRSRVTEGCVVSENETCYHIRAARRSHMLLRTASIGRWGIHILLSSIFRWIVLPVNNWSMFCGSIALTSRATTLCLPVGDDCFTMVTNSFVKSSGRFDATDVMDGRPLIFLGGALSN